MIEESYREWNRTHDEIRRHEAMGNLNRGIEITTHGIQTRLIAWPGNDFASPPQLDLYLNTPFFDGGSFIAPEWAPLPSDE